MIWENTLSGMVDSTASRFDESTQYKKSDYVWYAATGVKPKLYKAEEDINASEEHPLPWDASKWKEISISTEFTNKDVVKTKNKTTYGIVEFDGNDLIIKRGKSYKYYSTDKEKMYRKGDFVCGYMPPEAGMDFTIPGTIKYGFFDPWWDPDGEHDYTGALQSVSNNILVGNDDGEPVVNPDGDISQVPEGFIIVRYDWDEDAYIPYKIHQNRTFERLSSDILIHSLNVTEFQEKGYSVGDFMFADGSLVPGGDSFEPISGIQYVEPSPVKTTVMDLVTLQDEIAPTWEQLEDKYYGALFYYNYELYALMGIDEVYDMYGERDTTIFPNMVHLTELGEYVWANKITTLENLVELGTCQSGYTCSSALLLNLFSSESTLKVLMPESKCVKINGGFDSADASAIVIDAVADEKKYITIDWDLHGESVKFVFNKPDEDELWTHDSLVENFNIRNGEVTFEEWRFPDIEYENEPYYYLADNFHAENVTITIESQSTCMSYGKEESTFKNSKLYYIETGDATTPQKCYIRNMNLDGCSMLVGKTTHYHTVPFKYVGCSNIKAKNSDITLIFSYLKEFDGDFTNCVIEYDTKTEYNTYEDSFLIKGKAKYCDIRIGRAIGTGGDTEVYVGKYVILNGDSKYNCVHLDHIFLTDPHLPTMFPSGGRHVGNVLRTVDGIKWHDFPTT